jgi:hypothetical protein
VISIPIFLGIPRGIVSQGTATVFPRTSKAVRVTAKRFVRSRSAQRFGDNQTESLHGGKRLVVQHEFDLGKVWQVASTNFSL